MNNQAAQTMPELPKAWGFARNVDGQIEIRIGPVCPPNRSGGLATPWAPMFGGDQMHQYARDYAAMLAAAPAASSAHPDALLDGTLSKSTVKRVEALTQRRGGEPEPIAWFSVSGYGGSLFVSEHKESVERWITEQNKDQDRRRVSPGYRHTGPFPLIDGRAAPPAQRSQ